MGTATTAGVRFQRFSASYNKLNQGRRQMPLLQIIAVAGFRQSVKVISIRTRHPFVWFDKHSDWYRNLQDADIWLREKGYVHLLTPNYPNMYAWRGDIHGGIEVSWV